MQRQTEEIKEKMSEEKDRLSELEEYFAKIDANQKRQSMEVAVLAAFRKRVSMAENVLHGASTNIQKIVKLSVENCLFVLVTGCSTYATGKRQAVACIYTSDD